MGGRIQREIDTEQKIELRLASEPEYVKDFFYWMNGKSFTTKEKYIKYISHFIKFCCTEFSLEVLPKEKLGEINRNMMNKYIRTISNKVENGKIVGKNDPSIVNVKICAISTFFNYLMENEELIQKNPCKGLDRPKISEKDEVIYLTQDEIKMVFDAIENGVGSEMAKSRQAKWKTRDKLLFAFPLILGIRVSALIDIDVSDIDFDNQKVRVTEKENKRRTFLIPEELFALLCEWMNDREEFLKEYSGEKDALFLGIWKGKCKRLTDDGVNQIINKYTSSIGKKITAHKLRSTMAMNTYENTNDIYVVAEILGHKSPETTKRYARASAQKIGEATKQMSKFIGL